MKRVPNFYRRNAAAGAVRRVLDKKRADPEEARETVEQIVSLCVAMAAVSVMEWNEGRRDEYLRCANCCIEDYNIRAAAHNDQRAAQRWLDSVGGAAVCPACGRKPEAQGSKRGADPEADEQRQGVETMGGSACGEKAERHVH